MEFVKRWQNAVGLQLLCDDTAGEKKDASNSFNERKSCKLLSFLMRWRNAAATQLNWMI